MKVHHGYAFKGEYFVDDGADVLLTPKNFRAGGGLDVAPGRCRRYAGPVDRRFILDPGDVVIAMTDLKQDAPILGAAGRVPREGRYLHNQRIGRVEVLDTARLSPDYSPWLLNAPDVRSQVRATATGATVRHTAPERIHASVVRLPPEPVQRRIAAVLAAFDELIAVNQRRIAVLEDLARSVYGEWFERRQHRSSALAASDGWQRRRASEIFTINPRLRSTQSVFQKLTMADLDERHAAAFPSQTVERATGSRFQQADVLLARITPCLENGKTALVKFLDPGEVAVGSTEFIVLRGNSVGPAFTYCAARSDRLREHAIASMSGASGRQRVSIDAFRSLELVEPPVEVAKMFENRVGPLLDEAYLRERQSRSLARTRDLMLPRLVTGRLDISDVELGDLFPGEVG